MLCIYTYKAILYLDMPSQIYNIIQLLTIEALDMM